MCKPYDGEDLTWHAVTRAMNKPGYKEDDCSKPLKQGNISSFFKIKKRSSDAAVKPDHGASPKQAKLEAPNVKKEKM